MAFTKLDSGIVDSSLWAYPAEERIVWITLLAKSDDTGFVRISFSGLVRAANVSEEATKRAIEKFTAPDPESRTEEYEGRRIEHIEGGWVILNYMKYREKTDKDAHREYMRKYRSSRVNHGDSQSITVESPSASASASASSGASTGVVGASPVPEFIHPSPKATSLADDFRIAHYTANPSAKPDSRRAHQDAVDMELVLRDGRTVEDVREALAAVFRHRFWATKIHTVQALREKWNAGKLTEVLSGQPDAADPNDVAMQRLAEEHRKSGAVDAVKALRKSYGLDD